MSFSLNKVQMRGNIFTRVIYRGVEQLAARQANNLKVVGSSPTPATMKQRCDKLRHKGVVLVSQVASRFMVVKCVASSNSTLRHLCFFIESNL